MMSDEEDDRRVTLNPDTPSDLVMVGSRRTPNRMVRMAPMETDRDKEYLTLKVVRPSQELDSVEIHFRVKRTTQMGKLKRSYSDRLGVHVSSLRFLYDGRRISDDATPGSLEMESGDYIEVYRELGVSPPDTVITSVTMAAAAASAGDGVVLEAGPGEDTRRQQVRLHAELGAADQPSQSKRLKLGCDNNSGGGGGGYNVISLNTEAPAAAATSSADNAGVGGGATPSLAQELEAARAQLEQVTRKYDDLVRKLRDKVECPVCFEIPRSAPVPVCPNGHVVCNTCVRETCPTCRVKMQQATSTLAVTVIENIEHTCEHDNCGLTLPLPELPRHQAACPHRPVLCPGLDCSARLPLHQLLGHVVTCCVERGEVRVYKFPHKFPYMMNEDLTNLGGESQNFNWKLEAVKFDNKVFFLKVTRKARARRWFFYVQMVGCEEEALAYTAAVTVFRPDYGPEGKYSQRYSGDVCPIDMSAVDRAEEAGYCLVLNDAAMGKVFLKNSNSGENEFSVFLNISKV